MADALFGPGKSGHASGEIDYDTATIKVALIRGYTFNSAHKFVSDVTGAGGTIIGTTPALAGKTITDGVQDANDTDFGAPAAGPAATAYIVFQSSAVTGGADVASTAQRLIGYVDSASSLPITPNGTTINFVVDSGPNKLYAL